MHRSRRTRLACAAFAVGSHTSASASRGIALRLLPPSTLATRAPSRVQGEQHAGDHLKRVAAPGVDLEARVAALESRHAHLAGRCRPPAPSSYTTGHVPVRVAPARAADVQLALVFRVQVEERAAADEPGLQVVGAGEPRLLVHGEEELERPVGERLVLHHGQAGGHGDAVVGAERRPAGPQEVPVAHQLQRVLQEVVGRVLVLLADHVHVPLEAHAARLLVAGRGGLADEHVAAGVLPGLEAELLRGREEVGGDRLLVRRPARDPADLGEVAKDRGGLETIDGIRHHGTPLPG